MTKSYKIDDARMEWKRFKLFRHPKKQLKKSQKSMRNDHYALGEEETQGIEIDNILPDLISRIFQTSSVEVAKLSNGFFAAFEKHAVADVDEKTQSMISNLLRDFHL